MKKDTNLPECERCLNRREIRVTRADNRMMPCPKCQEPQYRDACRAVLRKKLKTTAGKLADYKWGDLDISEGLRARILDWMLDEPDGTGLTLIGEVGRGKSTIALTSALEYCVRHDIYDVLYVFVPKLLRQLRGTWDKNPDLDTEVNMIKRLEDCDLLILDNIVAGKEYAAGVLLEILDGRLLHRRTTIATSKHGMPELVGLLAEHGEDIVSRLVTMNGKAIRLEGKNRHIEGLE